MLQLPRIAPSIPAILAGPATQARSALLARAALHAGLVLPKHIKIRGKPDCNQVVAHALRDWLASALAGVQHIAPTFDVTLIHGPCCDRCDPEDEAPKAVVDVYGMHLGPFEVAVGPELDRLEALHAGLGATVLAAVDATGWKTLPIFTPDMALDTARHLFWGGYDSETEYLEECFEPTVDREDVCNSMPTRAMFRQTYPEWALGGARVLSGRALRRIARETTDAKARAVIRDVLTLRKMPLDGRRQREHCGEEGVFVGYCVALTWGESDRLTTRLVDDFMNDASESEFEERCGRFVVALDRVQALDDWLASMSPWVKSVVILDRLLRQLDARS